MGAVHGVYLKYVALGALSGVGYTYFAENDSSVFSSIAANIPFVRHGIALSFAYSTVLNLLIAALFQLRWGMGMIGKNRKTGQIPFWSYIIYYPFHLPTILYTHVHTQIGLVKGDSTHKVPVASEVQPGWWVGGWYSYQLNKEWGGVIDLTVEFPELCFSQSKAYLSLPSWDGVPAAPAQLEVAAKFAVEAKKNGPVLIHCAHGRGRSTTVMCAALVKAGLYPTWQDAFEKGIKPGRPVCKLNSMMKKALSEWQDIYVKKSD